MRAYINLEFDTKTPRENIKKVINYYERIKKNLIGHLSQINKTTLRDKFFEGAAKAINKKSIRYTSRVRGILMGFNFVEQGEFTNRTFTLTHKYYNNDPEYTYKTSRKVFRIKGSSIMSILDLGRKTYQIPLDPKSKILKWKVGKKTFVWRWKTLGPLIVPSMSGTHFIDYGIQNVLNFIINKQIQIKRLMEK